MAGVNAAAPSAGGAPPPLPPPASSSTAKTHPRGMVHTGQERAAEGENLPQKRFFRQRAHINPLGFTQVYRYPVAPERMEWAAHFPSAAGEGEEAVAHDLLAPGRYVEVADVGCGFGGLIVGLAPALTAADTVVGGGSAGGGGSSAAAAPPLPLMVGMEIRPKVTEYVRLRVLALRKQAASDAAARAAGTPLCPPLPTVVPTSLGADDGDLVARGSGASFQNVSVLKTNAMKYLPNFFARGQLSKLFFCFPDPQFKPSHHRRRIVTTPLRDEYAYALRPGARLYTITDVADLHNWMAAHGDAHPAFARVPAAEADVDAAVGVMREATEEGKKVARNGGQKHVAVFTRLSPEGTAAKAALHDFWTAPPVAYEYTPAPSQARHVKTMLAAGVDAGAPWQARVLQDAPPAAATAATTTGAAAGQSALV